MDEQKKKRQGASISVESVFQSAGIGLGVIDAEGGFLMANPALQALLQISEDELLNKSLLDFCVPKDVGTCYDQIQEVLFCDAMHQGQELCLCRTNGTTLWAHVTVSRPQPGSGPASSLVMTMNETTDYVELLRTLEQSLPAQQWEGLCA